LAAGGGKDQIKDLSSDGFQCHDFKIDIIGAGKILRQPEQHQEPDRIGEEFRRRKCPGFAGGNNLGLTDLFNSLGRIMYDPCQFGFAYLAAFARVAVEPQPQGNIDIRRRSCTANSRHSRHWQSLVEGGHPGRQQNECLFAKAAIPLVAL
jgi:hypothetical protein